MAAKLSLLWRSTTSRHRVLATAALVAAVVPISVLTASNNNNKNKTEPHLDSSTAVLATSSTCPDKNNMRSALVVGGTSGIGQGIALALAKRNVAVTIAGRSEERGSQIVEQLKQVSSSSGREAEAAEHSFHKVNGFDLASVKELALASNPDYLVMTQGMATIQGYTPTINGLDQKLQLHYFSRIYLAKLLAEKMSQKQNAKVLTVLSGGVHSKYNKYETDFELKDNYSIQNAAVAAGFYTDAGFQALATLHPSISYCHASPGFVNTNWGTEFPWYLRGLVRCLQPLGRSPEKCGEILTNAWLDKTDAGDNSNNSFYVMDHNGNILKDATKHMPEEGQVIWSKTLELLPKD